MNGRPPLEPRIKALEDIAKKQGAAFDALAEVVKDLRRDLSRSAADLMDPAGPVKPYQPRFDKWPGRGSGGSP